MTLHKRSKLDNELQPYFHQNECSSGLDMNIGLYGQPSVRQGCRDHLQSATLKTDTTKKIFNNFTIIQCSVTKITAHISGLLLVIIHFINVSTGRNIQ